MLPEDLGLFDDLTVEEHLLLTGDIYGVPRQETRARTSQLLHALSLEHGRRTFAAACSHGMRKKTAFAMALLPNPQVLFLDEPFEAIDPVTAKIMRDLLQSVARHGVTVFLTSHILSMVERIATQIVMIRKGNDRVELARWRSCRNRSRTIISIWWRRRWWRNWNGSARRDPEGAGDGATAATGRRSNRSPATIFSWSRFSCCSRRACSST